MNVFQLLMMKNETMYLTEDTAVSSAMDKLRASGYTAVPVIREDGSYAGTVSEGDFLWAFLDGRDEDTEGQSLPLKTIVRTDRNPAVKIDVDLAQLFAEALNQNFVPVVDDRNMFIGIVTRKKVLSFFMDKLKEIT
ncbi:MAG: CBS domain-containing protein [Lachnospiraceae bacterium]|nr:CBS domain-containing protein [Lachnospiraceae bacterium]